MSNDMPTPSPQNALRNQMVQRAVAQARDGKLPLTVRNVAMFLPGPTAYDAKLKAMPSFELDADDLRPFLPLSAETLEKLRDVELVLPDRPPVKDVVVHDPQRLANALLELERERNDLKFQHQTAIRDEVIARNDLDQIARAFLAGFAKPQSPDELLKDHARSEAERRRQIAAGEIKPAQRVSTVGPSVLDRFAAAQRGGNAGFAGQGYRRGAFSSAHKGQTVARPKVPSER
jgi:hypothetical protein